MFNVVLFVLDENIFLGELVDELRLLVAFASRLHERVLDLLLFAEQAVRLLLKAAQTLRVLAQ